jgi:hypothetical protein
MIIVLAVAFSLMGFIGSWLYKRHKRRQEANLNAGVRPPAEAWGPFPGSIHDVNSDATTNGASANEKGKERQYPNGGVATGPSRMKRIEKI